MTDAQLLALEQSLLDFKWEFAQQMTAGDLDDIYKVITLVQQSRGDDGGAV